MSEDDNITPEEKLLKVIQGGGPSDGSAAKSPDNPVRVAESVPGSSETGGGITGETAVESPPKLRIAKPRVAVQEKEEEGVAAGIAAVHMAADEAERLKREIDGDDLGDLKPAPVEEGKEEDRVAKAGPEDSKASGGGSGKDEPRLKRPGVIGASPAAHKVKRSRGQGMGIAALNKCLVVLILVVIAFAGLEIWANVRPSAVTGRAEYADVHLPAFVLPRQDLPPIDGIIEAFRQRPLMGTALEEPGPAPEPVARLSNADVYARENMALIGFSGAPGDDEGREAIIVDRKLNKMYILTRGRKIGIENREFVLEEIGSDHVVLVDQFGRIELK